MSEDNSTIQSTPVEKQVEVDPAAEGPAVKVKRQMTPAQLEALKRGREKLAEKRRKEKEEEETAEKENETDVMPDSTGAYFCRFM